MLEDGRRGLRVRPRAWGLAMMDTMVAWIAVLFSAAAFGGFLFGLTSAMTLLGRAVPSKLPAVRVQRPVRAAPRLWA